jgi:hypothetical protein
MLEVTFANFDEHFARAVVLNDHITLYTDTMFSAVWGLSFYDYARLLQVHETDLDGLSPLSEEEARRLLELLQSPPAVHFLEPVETGALRAIVKSPRLEALL